MAFDIKRIQKVQGRAGTVARTIPGISGLLGDTFLGEFLGISTKNVWRLKMIDSPNTEYRGQFMAQNLTENVGANISSQSSLNKQSQDKQYIGGDDNTLTFNARVWASSSIKNVKKSVELLKTFTERNEELKRAPIFTFTSGTDIQCKCFVKSIGGVQYDDPRSDGSIRGATFNVTLEKIEDVPTKSGLSLAALVKTGLGIVSAAQGLSKSGGKINIPGGSLHTKGRLIVTKQGQTFESIAQKEYGNALYGDILRRAHFQNPLNQIKASLEINDIVTLVDPNEITEITVAPQSICLKDNEENRNNFLAHFELRGGSKVVYY